MPTNRLILLLSAGALAVTPPATQAQASPPGTDIFLARITGEGAGLRIVEPRNVTARPGYDNQPSFLQDGSGFLFTVVDSTGQADIWRFDLASERTVRVTDTAPESEYSATPLPDGTGFSAVRVEADSTQRLWRFDLDGSSPSVLLPGVAPVGYHAWVDEETVLLFVLGQPPTLQVAHLGTGRASVAHRDIGRSLQPIPGEEAVSFPDRTANGDTWISRWRGSSIDPLVQALDNGQDHAWTPDGTVLMGRGSAIHAWRPDSGTEEWTPVGDVGVEGASVSRLAVSPDGRWIAIVAQIPGG